MQNAVELSVGVVPPPPLAYRFKGTDRFNAKMYRGRRQHDTWLTCHQKLWPKARTHRSEQQLLELGGANAPRNNNTIRFKQEIRGARSVEFLEQDADAMVVERFMILASGCQSFLNLLFKAESKVQELSVRLQNLSLDTSGIDQGLTELREECIQLNRSILSGDAASHVFVNYTQFFNYSSEVWSDWRQDRDGKYVTCLDLICVAGDAAYRIVFKVDVSKVELLCNICEIREGASFDLAKAKKIANDMLERASLCADCVDKCYTIIWCNRLLGGAQMARRAHLSLRDNLALLRTTSILVEKEHLIGQEFRPKKRGSAMDATQLAISTFRKLVTLRADARRRDATMQAMGNDSKLHQAFKKSLGDITVTGHQDRRSKVSADGATKKPKFLAMQHRKRTPVRGYDKYVQSVDFSTIEGGDALAKRKVVDAMWRGMSRVAKAPFEAAANAENEKGAENDGENFVQFATRQQRVLVSARDRRRSRYLSERARAVQQSIDEMINSPIFEASSKLFDFKSGVRPSLINTELSNEQAKLQCREIFGYDHTVLQNPKGRMTHFVPCCLKHGGFCKKDDLQGIAANLTHNLCAVSKSWKAELPVLLHLKCDRWHPHVECLCFLSRFLGDGNLAFVVRAIYFPKADNDDDHGTAEIDFLKTPSCPGGCIAPVTSHKFFVRMLQDAAAAVDADPMEINALQLTRWSFIDDQSVDFFRVRLMSIHTQASLSCTDRLHLRNEKATEETDLPFGMGKKPKSSSSKEYEPAAKKRKKVNKDVDPDLWSDCSLANLESERSYESSVVSSGSGSNSEVSEVNDEWNDHATKTKAFFMWSTYRNL